MAGRQWLWRRNRRTTTPPPSYTAILWPDSAILGNFELLKASWSTGLQNQGLTYRELPDQLRVSGSNLSFLDARTIEQNGDFCGSASVTRRASAVASGRRLFHPLAPREREIESKAEEPWGTWVQNGARRTSFGSTSTTSASTRS